MSAQDPAPDTAHADAQHSAATERLGIDARYTVVPDVDASGDLGALTDPFLDMVYPLNDDTDHARGVIHNSNRWLARHRPDGSGIVESSKGGATYGVRLADGTVIGNAEMNFWFPWHSDYHQRRPDDSGEVDVYDYDWFIQFPYQFLEAVLNEFTDIDSKAEESVLRLGTDAENVADGAKFMRGVVAADILDAPEERGVLLTHDSGTQVYIGWDSTAWDTYEMFGFVPFDGTDGVPAPSAADALDLLRPNEAAAAPDTNVTRQGEYFLVPAEEAAAGTIQQPGVAERPYGGSPLDSHIPRDWRPVVDDDTFIRRFMRAANDPFAGPVPETPQDCVDLLADGTVDPETDVTYAEVREMADGVQVRGTLRHRANEHEMVNVSEWRRATTHEWDVMTQDGQRYHME